MFCWKHGRYGRWSSDPTAAEGREARDEFRAWRRRSRWGRDRSGNVAFDEYREETLRKLDEEQREFRDYLDRLRVGQGPRRVRPVHERAPQPPARHRAAAGRIRRLSAAHHAPPRLPTGAGLSCQ